MMSKIVAVLLCIGLPYPVLMNETTEADFGVRYSGNVSENSTFNYHFSDMQSAVVRISVSSPAPVEYPVSFVALEQKSVRSWSVPFVVGSKTSYSSVSHTLCPTQNDGGALSIRVSTFSQVNLSYTVMANNNETFSLANVTSMETTAAPTQPLLLEYTFPDDVDTVIVKVSSDDDICAYLSVQEKKCPVYDVFDNVQFKGMYQSMTKQAAITVVKENYLDGFYVIIVIHPTDDVCNSRFEPLSRTSTLFYASTANERHKNLTVAVEKTNSKYLEPVLITLGIGVAFYTFIGLIVIGYWLKNWFTGKTADFPASQEEAEKILIDNPTNEDAHHQSGYGALDAHIDTVTEDGARASNRPVSLSSGVPQHDDADVQSIDTFDGFDTLEDIEHEQDVYLSKRKLFLSDTTRQTGQVREKRFRMYPWNLITVAVFYALPVVQLVITYQIVSMTRCHVTCQVTCEWIFMLVFMLYMNGCCCYALPVVQLVITYQIVVNVTGNEDTCYYNFLCSRPASVFSAFNNVFSNIGYIMLGILFWLLVWRREIIYKKSIEAENASSHLAQATGIPKHYSLFYALAVALIVEGVMSGCYHVCPNNTNFQFDTSFMYMIACLCVLKLYQQRHPDINPESYRVFFVLALIVFLGMLGVLFHNIYTYIIFFLLHVTTCGYMSLHVYYKSTVRFDTGTFARARLECRMMLANRDFKPLHLGRFVTLLFGNSCNWALSLFGLVTRPLDFASFLLSIFIMDLLLYLGFYIIMKIFHKERLTPLVLFFIFMTILLWIPALYFFEQGVTAWQETPALSRVHNRPCIVFDFYDSHDIWHFLSAGGLFFSFMTIFVLDDDLEDTPRDKIPVF
ncbi:SID1 transmembrane family member 1-like isoform X2 [Apostichopus japonicus]|uniref:SID1 transmembrane family member 1-like isoform X2 n=1 Tax=Stichopus japonicus TaxID=307972 RepID=UPI003AB55997